MVILNKVTTLIHSTLSDCVKRNAYDNVKPDKAIIMIIDD